MATDILKQMRERPKLSPTCVKVYAYGNNEPLPLLGAFQAQITHQDSATTAKVYVTTKGSRMLLSCNTAEELGVVMFALSVHLKALDALI